MGTHTKYQKEKYDKRDSYKNQEDSIFGQNLVFDILNYKPISYYFIFNSIKSTASRHDLFIDLFKFEFILITQP